VGIRHDGGEKKKEGEGKCLAGEKEGKKSGFHRGPSEREKKGKPLRKNKKKRGGEMVGPNLYLPEGTKQKKNHPGSRTKQIEKKEAIVSPEEEKKGACVNAVIDRRRGNTFREGERSPPLLPLFAREKREKGGGEPPGLMHLRGNYFEKGGKRENCV